MAVAAGIRPVRVVIIDDTLDLRELLRLALTRGGLEVVGEAGDGLSGIECVRDEQPDVVLLDLSMPVMDGLEALPTIRRIVPDAKIVVLSGFGATQMSEKAMAIGADGYLQKGIALKRIIEFVKDIVDAPNPFPARPSPEAPADPSAAEASSEPAPALSVVAEGPDQPAVAEVPAAAGAETEAAVSAWAALAMAPYGVVEVRDEPAFRLMHANPMAQRLLDHRARVGTPLGEVAPELASLVAYNRLDGDASFQAVVHDVRLQASLRRYDGSLLIYLDPSSDDVGILRRAIATTAKEVRGPVAVLTGVAESIAESGSEMSEAQRQRLMASVVRQSRMLEIIAADLLTAAEIQRGALHVHSHAVDPHPLVESVVRDRFLATVSIGVDDQRQVVADPARLEHMLCNLVGNALKYGRAPYAVQVETDPDDRTRVRILVIDAGDGVPEDFRDQLFREFARPAGAVTTGTGLGLYVVKALAEAQGGRVAYEPGPLGGAVFSISLPAV